MITKINIVLENPRAKMPVYAHIGDAGADLCAALEEDTVLLVIPPGHRGLISTGLRMDIPHGYEVQIRPRSGLAFKHGVTVLNAPGTIDAGYRGVVGVILANFGDQPFEINNGDRIAQMVVARIPDVELHQVSELDETVRGTGGFGSTGTA